MSAHRPGEFSWGGFFRGIAKRLGVRTGRLPDGEASTSMMDDWATVDPGKGPDALEQSLREIERDALSTYEANGLPTRSGHYARAPGEREWQFVAESLLPKERWALVQDYPPGEGWRFATLQALGLQEPEDSPAAVAARLLGACTALRASPQARQEATMLLLQQSIQLGSDWRAIKNGLADTRQPVEIVKPMRIDQREKPD